MNLQHLKYLQTADFALKTHMSISKQKCEVVKDRWHQVDDHEHPYFVPTSDFDKFKIWATNYLKDGKYIYLYFNLDPAKNVDQTILNTQFGKKQFIAWVVAVFGINGNVAAKWKSAGLCPHCGDDGEWINMGLTCRRGHGVFI